MKFMYLTVEPPARLTGRIPTVNVFLGDIQEEIDACELKDRLYTGESFNNEQLYNERIGDCPDPGTEKGREEESTRIHEEVTRGIVELLNIVQPFHPEVELNSESTFQLVESLPEDNDDWRDSEISIYPR